jgi:16S rRNA (guanine527-N7)-methyltransferase
VEPIPLASSQLIVNKHLKNIPAASVPGLTTYLAEVLAWTRDVPLISRRDPVATCERLLLESLEIERLAAVTAQDVVVDVGTGAGFPGVVWALLHPETRFLLIERRERKVVFLERLVRALPLGHVEVFGGEARAAARSERNRGRFSLAVTMAVGSPLETAREIEGLLAPGARFISTLSRHAAPDDGKAGFTLVSSTAGEYGRYVVYRFGV